MGQLHAVSLFRETPCSGGCKEMITFGYKRKKSKAVYCSRCTELIQSGVLQEKRRTK